jgi:hypothetical protein
LPDIATHLGLMRLSKGFLGMSTGPCNFAIFSKTPYVIFKNTFHHRDQIQKALDADHLKFAGPKQFFVNENENASLIEKYFLKILN